MRGVCWHKGAGKWSASARIHGKTKYIGLFGDPIEAEQAVRKAIRDAGEDPTKKRACPSDRRISLLAGVAWNYQAGGWMSEFGKFLTEYEAWESYAKGMISKKRKDADQWSDVQLVPGFNGRYAVGAAGVLDLKTMHRARGKAGMVRIVHASGVSMLVEIEKVMNTGMRDVDPLDLPGKGMVVWDAESGKWTIDGKVAPRQKAAYYQYLEQIGRKKLIIRNRIPKYKPKRGDLLSADRDNPYRKPAPHRKVVMPSSMTPGVSFNKKAKKWVAYYQKKHLGSFATEELAIEALNKAKGL